MSSICGNHYEASNPPVSPSTLEITSSRDDDGFLNESGSDVSLKPIRHSEFSYAGDTSKAPCTTALLERMPLVIEMVTNVLRTAQNILDDSVEEANVQNEPVDLINHDNSAFKEFTAENVSIYWRILVHSVIVNEFVFLCENF